MKPYTICLIASAGLHGGLFGGWPSGLQPANLPLQAGREAVSFELVEITLSSLQAEPKTVNEAANPNIPNVSNTGNKQDSVEFEANPNENPEPEREVKRANIIKPNKIEPIPAMDIAKSSRTLESKPQVEAPQKKEVLKQDQETSLQTSTSKRFTAVSLPEGVTTQATPLSSQKPKYPKPAIVRNQQGKVTVRLLIDRAGKVQTVELIKSSGYRLLDKSVLRFVEQEKFVSASQKGIPVDSTQEFSFRFVLK
jgi:TonB family protein